MSKKLFRFHRGSLADSLATTIEVTGLTQLKNQIEKQWQKGCLKNIRIKNEPISDPRLPKEWNGVSYYVVADIPGYEGQCIGLSNFYEEVSIGQCTDNGQCGYQVTTDCKYSAWDNRTAEERKDDEASAQKSAFLEELRELLRKYNAELTWRVGARMGNKIILAQPSIEVNTPTWSFSFEREGELTITADNIMDYDKKEV